MTITVTFRVTPNPDTPEHQHQIAKAYLAGKGVRLDNYEITI